MLSVNTAERTPKSMIKTYSELIQYSTFEDRFNYLKLSGQIGEDTFGFNRYLNQKFYISIEWQRIRDQIIVRDNGCDLGIIGRPISGRILIHHINPLTVCDISKSSDFLLNPDNLICVSHETHNALHYGDIYSTHSELIDERSPNDTCPWKKVNY